MKRSKMIYDTEKGNEKNLKNQDEYLQSYS